MSDPAPFPGGAAHRFVGASVRRKEDPRFLTGHGTYLDDLTMTGMLHAAFVRSHHARARIVAIDAERARQAPGVHAVLTAEQINRHAPGLWAASGGTPQGSPMRGLADGMTRYVGDPVALVVADNRYLAEDACELIEVEYEPLPAVIGVDAGLTDQDLVHPEVGTNIGAQVQPDADSPVPEILAGAPHVITETLEQHRYVAVPMETRGIIARWDPYVGELTAWISSQGPHMMRATLANALGIPEQRVRVIMEDVGGGFGQKIFIQRDELCIVLASRELGRPIKWIEDRVENLVAATHSREERLTFSAAVDDDGAILAVDVDHVENLGAYHQAGSVGGLVKMMITGPYRIPHLRFRNRAVYTNTGGRGPYRGPWMMESLARETMMDIIAHRLGIDPLELRRRNIIRATDLPYTTASGADYDVVSVEATLEQAAAMLDYEQFRKEQELRRSEGRYLGVGISVYVEPSAMSNAERAAITVDPTGKVTVMMGTASHGHSLATTMSQIVADYLGVDIDDVRFVQGDTAIIPSGGGTMGSRSAVTAGGAAREAAIELRAKVLRIAAHRMEAAPEDLEMQDGVVSVKGTPTRKMTLGEVAVVAAAGSDLPEGEEAGLEVNTNYRGRPGVTWSNAAHICTCEVDIQTGEVNLLRYIVSEDCGTMINPMVVEGQISGGVVQGIGGVLLEHFVYDRDGNPLTTTFLDYLLPTTTEVPILEIGHIETPSNRPGGFKGMGEGGAIGSPAAIINAVLDALTPLGVRSITRQPLSPSAVLDLIANAAG